jgi:hypothetical protein
MKPYIYIYIYIYTYLQQASYLSKSIKYQTTIHPLVKAQGHQILWNM